MPNNQQPTTKKAKMNCEISPNSWSLLIISTHHLISIMCEEDSAYEVENEIIEADSVRKVSPTESTLSLSMPGSSRKQKQ